MLAATALRAKAHGRDPAAERRAAKASQECSTSFADVLPAYLAHIKSHNRCAAEMQPPLHGFANLWAGRPLASISAQDCYDMVERCRAKGMPGRNSRKAGPSNSRARLGFALLQGFFSWAVRQRKLERSPLHGLEAPRAATARDRVLDDPEILVFWNACATLSPWYCGALQLLLLTGQRLREISELRFDEIVDSAILLGPQRTKNKRRHVIPLSTLAQEVLARVPRVEGSPFVFSSSGRVPIDGWSMVKRKLDAAMRAQGWNGPAFRIHDLRRTAASTLARLGVPLHVTEKILNHTSGSFAGIAGVYQRYSFQPEMAEALEKLAAFVRQLIAAETVRAIVA
jgi:integrase